MSELSQTRAMWDHALWADMKVFQALQAAPHANEAWREFAHILGEERAGLLWSDGGPYGGARRAALEPAQPHELCAEYVCELAPCLVGVRRCLECLEHLHVRPQGVVPHRPYL